ncbi:MAG: NADH-quinone oxidoreductase subunit N [Rhodothermales bacterium]
MDIDLSQAYASLGADLGQALSLILLTVGGMVIVTWDAFKNNASAIPWAAAGFLGVAALIELVALFGGGSTTIFFNMMHVGGFAAFINLIIIVGGLLSVILSEPYLRRIGRAHGEVYAIILFATVGMMVLGTANHLLMIFVGLETMSICLYILTGLVREEEGATESALKYFLLGAFATGFFLYGIALLYGATGTMVLTDMQAGLVASGSTVMFWAGVGLLLIGFFFKVSAAPFHMWTPDVYQGAPTTLTGYMSTASKASAFAALTLVLYYALPPERWSMVLAIIALITMVVGNVLALAQQNVKRMLAYSSIAHAGYILVGLASGLAEGYSGALFYLLIYTLMNIGAFGVLAMFEWDGKQGSTQTLDSLAGLGQKNVLLGVTMGFFMFSLAGFPPLAGFLGKIAVFGPAVEAGLVWLAILGVLTSAISAYYYLRVLVYLFLKPSSDASDAASAKMLPVPGSARAVLVFCAVLLVVLGVMPAVWDMAGNFFADAGVLTTMVP